MTPELRIRLLGGFSLARGEEGAPLRSQRLRMLLAYLALCPGQRTGRQTLAFAFWPDSPEKQARANLRNLLFQLRDASMLQLRRLVEVVLAFRPLDGNLRILDALPDLTEAPDGSLLGFPLRPMPFAGLLELGECLHCRNKK